MNELGQENKELKQEIQELRRQLSEAQELIKQLKEQLGQNSRNSSWPPSRDKNRGQTKSKSRRLKSQRKAGGQKGHQGHTLKYTPTPDVIEKHRPEKCQHCQAKFEPDMVASQVDKRQVLDLPPLHFITTEHQVETIVCPHCRATTAANFPEFVTNSVQYGSQVKQLALYLKCEQLIPYERSRQLLADLFGLPVATSSLQNFVTQGAQAVEPVANLIKEAIIRSEVAHADETGFTSMVNIIGYTLLVPLT